MNDFAVARRNAPPDTMLDFEDDNLASDKRECTSYGKADNSGGDDDTFDVNETDMAEAYCC
jgi:hypothetical protein